MKNYSKEDLKRINSLIELSGGEKERSSHFWFDENRKSGFGVPIIVECFGITYPDPQYRVKRNRRNNFVIEYVVDGEGEVQVDNQKFRVKRGDSYFLFPHTNQEYHADRNHPFKKYWINFRGEVITNIIKDLGIYGINHFPNADLEKEFLSLFSIENDGVLSDEVIFSVFPLVMNMLLILHENHYDTSKHIPEKIVQAEKMISDVQNEMSVKEICEELGFSKSYLDREFKKHYKTTIIRHKNIKKMDIACAYLQNSDLSISEIADKLAFKDMYRFSHMFKKIKGISPLKYRQSLRNN